MPNFMKPALTHTYIRIPLQVHYYLSLKKKLACLTSLFLMFMCMPHVLILRSCVDSNWGLQEGSKYAKWLVAWLQQELPDPTV